MQPGPTSSPERRIANVSECTRTDQTVSTRARRVAGSSAPSVEVRSEAHSTHAPIAFFPRQRTPLLPGRNPARASLTRDSFIRDPRQDLRVRQRRRRRHAPRSRRAHARSKNTAVDAAAFPVLPDPPSGKVLNQESVSRLLPERVRQLPKRRLLDGVTYANALRIAAPRVKLLAPRVRQLVFLGRARGSFSIVVNRGINLFSTRGDSRLVPCVYRRGKSTSSRFTPRVHSRRSASRAGSGSTTPKPSRSSRPFYSNSSETAATVKTWESPRSWTRGGACSASDTCYRPSSASSTRCRWKARSSTAPSSSPCTTRSRRTTATSRSRSTALSYPSRRRTPSRPFPARTTPMGRRARRSARRPKATAMEIDPRPTGRSCGSSGPTWPQPLDATALPVTLSLTTTPRWTSH